MSYPHASWKPYGTHVGGFIIEVNVKEASGTKLDHFVVYNEKAYQQILKVIKKKYGFSYPEENKIPITMVSANIIHGELEMPFKKDELNEEQKNDLKLLQDL